MSNSTDQFNTNLFDGLEDNINPDWSPFSPDLLEQCSQTLTTDPEFADILRSVIHSPDMITLTPSGYSPENNSNHEELTNHVSQAVVLPLNMQLNPTRLEIIAEPYYGTKLRYRSDYDKNVNRLGVLKNRNKDSSYQGPAIRIPQHYLNPNDGYYIRVSLVTIEHNNLHYFHPYELEHPLDEQFNDRDNNSVWFPIQSEDCSTGIKSFPLLRIVKKRASDLKAYGNLRVFDCDDQNLQNNRLPQLTNPKDTIEKYNLDKTQLVFIVGRKIINNNQLSIDLYPDTKVFSKEMVEGANKECEDDNDNQSTSERPILSPPNCRVYKYAPRYGFDASQEDMVIFLMNKPEPKKYGELSVTFECDIPGDRWSQPVDQLEIKDRMIVFKTPVYPYPFEITKDVDVILRQNNRIIETIKYYYLATVDRCSNCQSNAVGIRTNVVPNVSNKRTKNMVMELHLEEDCVVPVSDIAPKFQQSLSEPLQESSVSVPTTNTSTRTSLPAINLPQTSQDPHEQVMNVIASSIESLFIDNDYIPFLRISRSFLKKSPELIHNATINNNTDLLLKFIPIATIDILQQKNQFGETVLLHAIRLNRIEIVKTLLENKNSEKLLEDIDGKNNNIFHIIALNLNLSDILDLLINYFLNKSINIQEKFDRFNKDHLTPLQLSVCKNNLLITKYFLKYFNTNIHETNDLSGDNLIHLAVKHCDLIMVKYLIEEGQLIEQGKQSNLTKTPDEFAQLLGREDMVEYFNKLYPQPEIEEDSSDDDDDDDD